MVNYEEWREIKGAVGGYLVSSLGNIKSVRLGRNMRLQEDGKGYLRVQINRRTFKVHRLVAEHFLDRSETRDQVNHINGDKKDNSITNLEWVTGSENVKHSYAVLSRTIIPSEERVGAKLTEEAVKDIRENYIPRKVPLSYFANKYGVDRSLVHRVFHGRNWKKSGK